MQKALVSVKGGENVGVGMVRDLIAVVNREKAAIGVLISLALPTRAMEREAIAAGFFETPFEKVPKRRQESLREPDEGPDQERAEFDEELQDDSYRNSLGTYYGPGGPGFGDSGSTY